MGGRQLSRDTLGGFKIRGVFLVVGLAWCCGCGTSQVTSTANYDQLWSAAKTTFYQPVVLTTARYDDGVLKQTVGDFDRAYDRSIKITPSGEDSSPPYIVRVRAQERQFPFWIPSRRVEWEQEMLSKLAETVPVNPAP